MAQTKDVFTPGSSARSRRKKRVRILKSTHIQSIKRDGRVGEIVQISFKDFRYLITRGYVEEVE